MKGSDAYTFGSLFAGIGGICLGFSKAGFTVKWANELDKHACETYRYNESKISKGLEISEGDIRHFDPPCKVDVLGGGFPCQPYSVAGPMRGFDDDERGRPMFDEIIRVANICKPRVIFLENVGNLKTFEDGNTFKTIMASLAEAGFDHQIDVVLNSKDYSGIAQFRNRIYIVAFRKRKDYEAFRHLYGDGLKPKPIEVAFDEIVGKEAVPDKYYYSQDDRSRCVSIRYNEHFVPAITEKGVFYQYRRDKIRRNKSGLCPALTASMGGGGHNVPLILDDRGIRKLTPQECLKVQGFPNWYKFPEGMADCHKYRQAGNSVSVPVINSFAKLIRKALEEVDSGKRHKRFDYC